MENGPVIGMVPQKSALSNPTSSGSASNPKGTPGVVHICLKDVVDLIRTNVVSVPAGFTKLGHPVLFFPDVHNYPFVPETDVLLLFRYYLSVVPRTEQATGFSLVMDGRGSSSVGGVTSAFHRIATLFPARVREVYLLYPPNMGAADLAAENKDFLLDFDVFHMEEPEELTHYIDPKYLHTSIGGQLHSDTENWLLLQEHVESFSFNARRIARRLAQFVGVLNSEEVSYRNETLRDVATKNRNNYRRLRKELEDLTDRGLLMLKSLQRPDANVMQRLAVQVLCKQLDQAWTYFNRSWKMQDHIYVQYLELNTFQHQFRELANAFAENERESLSIPISGNSNEEINAALDKLDSCVQTLTIDGSKARELVKIGQELLADHNFVDCIQPKCTELKLMCQKLEILLLEKRRVLHKFLDLMDCVESMAKWSRASIEHLDRRRANDETDRDENVFSQIRQVDYLLSKSRDLKIRTRTDFDELFDEIKELMSAQTLFRVDDALEQLDSVTHRVIARREELRSQATRSEKKFEKGDFGGVGNGGVGSSRSSESMKTRRENILSELLCTECRYVSDLESVLLNYRDKLVAANGKANLIFGNLDEIHHFHSKVLYPDLERCGANPSAVAKTFSSSCQDLKSLYSAYCQNMPLARQALSDLGGEAPPSLLYQCQTEAGHQLPLSSYLLKPMQRLTKYQLMLRDLAESSNVVCGKEDLQEALNSLLGVIKVVNDSLNDVSVKGLPKAVSPLGSLVSHDVFQVTSENKSQSQILFRNRSQRRHVFLYENHVLVCKPLNEKTQNYQFKFSLGTSSLGMSSIVKGEDKKIELWVHGRGELYSLEAKTKKAKEDFASELRKVIIKQKEQRSNSMKPQIYYDTASSSTTTATTNSSGGDSQDGRLTRSRSLESSRVPNTMRSRSLDYAGDRSSDEEEEDGGRRRHKGRYLVLADYMALTSREIDLSEDDTVELIKVGCAGWWYVRLTSYPYPEGWAPSTYLDKINE